MACKAKRQGDQMYCAGCHLRWDYNDPEPPPCTTPPAVTSEERWEAIMSDVGQYRRAARVPDSAWAELKESILNGKTNQ